MTLLQVEDEENVEVVARNNMMDYDLIALNRVGCMRRLI